jgi:GT2 family glycosyltransferase
MPVEGLRSVIVAGPQLSVIVVNWNSRDFLRRCLASLNAHCHDVSLEVIVVDSGSFDGCEAMLGVEFPATRFIQSKKNIGFAKANNLGAHSARGQFLLFLNPDTELTENSIRIMLDKLTALPQAGAIGCKLLNSDHTLQTSCIQAFPTVFNQVINSEFLRRRFPDWRTWGNAILHAEPPRTGRVEVLSGACIMANREAFEAVGGFTEQYFMYGEDADLCFKIARSGRIVYYTPETSIIHHGGGCSRQAKNNFSNVMLRESIYRFLKLNRGPLSASVYRGSMAISSVIRLPLIFLLLPISGSRVIRHGSGSLGKWLSILRWGLGLESWVQTYPEPA